MVVYPVSGGQYINVAAVVYVPGSDNVYDRPWVETVAAEQVVELYEGWDPRAVALIKVQQHSYTAQSAPNDGFVCRP